MVSTAIPQNHLTHVAIMGRQHVSSYIMESYYKRWSGLVLHYTEMLVT
jgi:hypothetical protein